MAAAYMLSQHSSNPLEVASSDIRNTGYVRQYRKATTARTEASSDEVIGGCAPPDEYHQHLANLYGNANLTASTSTLTRSRVVPGFVDLDEDMDSEAEAMANEMEEDVAEAQDENEEGEEDVDVDIEDATNDAVDAEDEEELEEENSILLKPPDERADIREEIEDLERAVPQLLDDYKILDRLGTGTFSSVYKAIDLEYRSKWDNRPWQGSHPPSSSAYYQSKRYDNAKVFVAIKRIYVTSGPERIRNEISILEDCRSCRHVSQLITAFREKDQVVAIMPYHRNEDFRLFYRSLPLEGVKAYFRCMFRALRDIHSRGIIHRDVKPANFLFDPRTGIGTLCDFGLACRMEKTHTLGFCLHTPPTRTFPHGKVRSIEDCRITTEEIKKAQREARAKSLMPTDKVGYPEKDQRPPSKANRAGTRGFRAPEVLFKCSLQTGAIDVWSAGMIMLFFLIKKFPLFISSDDTEALMEIAVIVGKRRMEKTATLHSRTFATNVPSVPFEGISWKEFVIRQNPDIYTLPDLDTRFYPYASRPGTQQHHVGPPPSSSSPPTSRYSSSRSPSPQTHALAPTQEVHNKDIDNALDLIDQLMHPEATRRITPKDALAHPFLKEPDEPDDDEFVPHRLGEGICKHLHFFDEETDEHCVKIFPNARKISEDDHCEESATEVRRLVAGEGVAIGRMPCEFHREELGYKFAPSL